MFVRRVAAESARPLLTKKVYGVQYGSSYIRNHFIEELGLQHEEEAVAFGSSDSFIPKGVKLYATHNLRGKRERDFNLAALVSSIDELMHIVKLQSREHQQDKKQQNQNFEQQKQNQWSSQHIVSLLNLYGSEREQLEGSLHAGFNVPLQMIAFDNRTIEQYIRGKYPVLV